MHHTSDNSTQGAWCNASSTAHTHNLTFHKGHRRRRKVHGPAPFARLDGDDVGPVRDHRGRLPVVRRHQRGPLPEQGGHRGLVPFQAERGEVPLDGGLVAVHADVVARVEGGAWHGTVNKNGRSDQMYTRNG